MDQRPKCGESKAVRRKYRRKQFLSYDTKSTSNRRKNKLVSKLKTFVL